MENRGLKNRLQEENTEKEEIVKVIAKTTLVAVIVIIGLLASSLAVFAAPPEKVEKAVCPVIGGPNDLVVHGTPATVNIPANNPAIGNVPEPPEPLEPGDVFWPLPPTD